MTAFNATKQMERLDNSERSSWIDLSRVIAILGVIFIHSSGPFFGNDSNLLIVFYVQIMPDDFVMQLHRF